MSPRAPIRKKTTDPRRSALMKSVRRQDTAPEIAVRRFLHASGLRFRLHDRKLPGTPDIVLPHSKTVVFVHGCFWHGHDCAHGRVKSRTNPEYWAEKIDANRSRDQQKKAALEVEGWRVEIIWECETGDHFQLDELVDRIHKNRFEKQGLSDRDLSRMMTRSSRHRYSPQFHPNFHGDLPMPRLRSATALAGRARRYDSARVRADFPIFERQVNGRPLTYLDSAASAQRPRAVIAAVDHYETHLHANVHRGVHALSQEATAAYEGARERVRRFLNARSTKEIIFTRGTTEAINLVANAFARPRLGSGDEIVLTRLEHHANIVPWQMAAAATGATLRVAPIDERGELRFDEFAALLTPRTRLVATAHVSNALGTVLPVARIVAAAHARGIPVLLDGAQAVPHGGADVQALGCDFYAFSGHKIYGPTGIGVLYGREALLREMPPWQGGGDMILSVSFEGTTYNDLPWKFEAGTPNISGAIGLAAAIEYLDSIGPAAVRAHEQQLLATATAALQQLPGLRVIGTAAEKAAVLSFTIDGIHPHDLGTILDHEGVAIRTGHHCAMPVMDFFGLAATARASFGCYNDLTDIDRLVAALHKAHEVFG